jgi:hypothetical protein
VTVYFNGNVHGYGDGDHDVGPKDKEDVIKEETAK